MADLDDTCVLYRGGVEALALSNRVHKPYWMRADTAVETAGSRMRELDRELIAKTCFARRKC
jgi:triphosphoribosyl-dephospho-CoA synthetase